MNRDEHRSDIGSFYHLSGEDIGELTPRTSTSAVRAGEEERSGLMSRPCA
jgi:hypothetical protein